MDYGRYTNLAADGVVICMPRPGGLHRVVVNFRGTGPNVLTLYDSAVAAAGAVLAVIDLTSPTSGTLHFGVACKNGVVAMLSGGTPGNVTVVTD